MAHDSDAEGLNLPLAPTRNCPIQIFRLMDLPPEIRNNIYAHMVAPIRALKELTGHTSDWFNTSILCVNRQVCNEASGIINNQMITVVIRPFKWYPHPPCVPRASQLKQIAFQVHSGEKSDRAPDYYRLDDWFTELAHQLNQMPNLEEIHIAVQSSDKKSCPKLVEDAELIVRDTLWGVRHLNPAVKLTVEGHFTAQRLMDLMKEINSPWAFWREGDPHVRLRPKYDQRLLVETAIRSDELSTAILRRVYGIREAENPGRTRFESKMMWLKARVVPRPGRMKGWTTVALDAKSALAVNNFVEGNSEQHRD